VNSKVLPPAMLSTSSNTLLKNAFGSADRRQSRNQAIFQRPAEGLANERTPRPPPLIPPWPGGGFHKPPHIASRTWARKSLWPCSCESGAATIRVDDIPPRPA